MWTPERPQVVLCPDPQSYQSAVHTRAGVPVIARAPGDLHGFGRDLVALPFAEGAGADAASWAHRGADSDRLCLVLTESNCAAAATVLAACTGRRLLPVAPEDDWEAALN